MRIDFEGIFTLQTISNLQDFYWHWYPSEISWAELQEANPKLYDQVRAAGRLLITLGIEEESIFKGVKK